MLKRLIILGIIGVLSLTFLMGAEKPKGAKWSSTFNWTTTVDTTVLRQLDTFSTYTGSTGKLFRCDYLRDYSKIQVRYVIEYTDLDTGNGGTYPDTTKDTVSIRFYTADEAMTASKLIYTSTTDDFHVTAAKASGDYQWINLTDSTQADNIYTEIITTWNDSTDYPAAATYKITMWYWFK